MSSATGEPKPEKILKKRTELPIYTEKSLKSVQNNDEARNELILHGVQLFRSEGCKLVRSVQSVSDRCSTFFRTGVAHATSNYVTTVDYLREDRNILQRIGAISGGVLFGYILGIRKGFFKRLLYTTSGGISAAAICYPNEAEEYLKHSSQLSKKYAIISYHFLNGVSKDLTGYELPTFPLKPASQEPQESSKKD
ncbi:MICOS complex subunit MIC27 [Planococcus citri]|uniref:MICOS complex subunit MIC27 n=1 Tax=Planococcus citri TaxID=170843 RepID=UPI0031F78778